MNDKENAGWIELMKDHHVMSTDIFEGVAVLSHTAECVYSQGELSMRADQDWKQFVDIFLKEDPLETMSLQLDGKPTKFIVFKKTQSSVYGTSPRKLYNLVVCSFPLGVMVCISKAPTLMSRTVIAAEQFSSILK